jgi:hypothetical protein
MSRRDAAVMALICGSDKAKYFQRSGLTRIRGSHLSGKSLAENGRRESLFI